MSVLCDITRCTPSLATKDAQKNALRPHGSRRYLLLTSSLMSGTRYRVREGAGVSRQPQQNLDGRQAR